MLFVPPLQTNYAENIHILGKACEHVFLGDIRNHKKRTNHAHARVNRFAAINKSHKNIGFGFLIIGYEIIFGWKATNQSMTYTQLG